MTPGIMGEGAQSMPDYDTVLKQTLDKTIIMANLELDPKYRLNERTHRLIRELPGTNVKTIRDLLGLHIAYIADAENIAGRVKEALPGFEQLWQRRRNHIENYLVAVEILPVAYMQSTSRKGFFGFLKKLKQHVIRLH